MKKLNFTGLTLIFIFVFSFNGLSQAYDIEKLERLNSQKIAFYTQKLQLTSAEAEKFWPVYNEYQRKKNDILLEKRDTDKYLRQSFSTLTDKEIEDISDKYIAFNKAEADLLTTYHEQFKKVLPIKKVIKLYQAENQFKEMLLRQIRNNQQRKKQNPNYQ
ncbi:MAG: hypothetical protein QNK30_12405 [Bacteroidales bacterium]|nr:hypothetical protein [Bacteroidales bacterium]